MIDDARIIEAVVNDALCGIYVYDLEIGKNVYINPVYTRITGWALDDFEAMSAQEFSELFHPDDRTRISHYAEDLGTGSGNTGELEYRIRTRDAGWIWCVSRAVVLDRSEDGHVLRMVGTFVDITAQKAALMSLAAQSALLGQTQGIARLGSWEFDHLSGGLTWSDEHYRIFGADKQTFEPTYEKFFEQVHPEDRADIEAAFAASMAPDAPEFDQIHRIVVPPHGEVRFIHGKCTHERNAHGQVVRSVGMAHDVTERQEWEELHAELAGRLEQSERLQSIGVLAGGIAHDFNNLLAVIGGHAELARLKMQADTDAERDIDRILEASAKAANLCQSMLAYAGRGALEVSVQSLNAIVQENLELFGSVVSESCAIEPRLDAGLGFAELDTTRIHQVLMNLILNASDAIGANTGKIVISTGNIELGESPHEDQIGPRPSPGAYVWLSIRDSGCGFPTTMKSRIFEPFYSSKFSGHGLGLSAVIGIIQQHRGGLRVSSTPGEGSEFTMFLPASTEVFPAAAALVADHGGRLSGTVLLVDDEERLRELGAEMLSLLGLEVLTARDGAEALDVYARAASRIDAVLLDLTMPGMSGKEALQKLLQLEGDLKVIICSGYSDQEIVSQFAGSRIAGRLKKPYTLESLSAMLSEVLRS